MQEAEEKTIIPFEPQLMDHYNAPNELISNTLLVVIILFILYFLVSGPILLLLFRLKRKNLIKVLIIISVIFSISSIFTAIYIRNADGKVSIVRITEITDNSCIEHSAFYLTSNGNSNNSIHLHADNVTHHRYTGDLTPIRPGSDIEQANDQHKMSVPITPWGKVKTYARNYSENLKAIDVKINVKKSNKPILSNNRDYNLTAILRSSEFQVNIINNNQASLKDIKLLFRMYVPLFEDGYGTYVYANFSINRIKGQERFNQDINLRFSDTSLQSILKLPPLRTAKKIEVFIYAQYDAPQKITSDFTNLSLHNEKHYIVQKVDSSSIPDFNEFIDTETLEMIIKENGTYY